MDAFIYVILIKFFILDILQLNNMTPVYEYNMKYCLNANSHTVTVQNCELHLIIVNAVRVYIQVINTLHPTNL